MDSSDENPLLQHLPPRKKVVPTLPGQTGRDDNDAPAKTDNPAVDLIRQKIDQLYIDEPSAEQEIAEAKAAAKKLRSKHQQFMYDLSTSGKSLPQIQTAWHEYYTNLPDAEKHVVWKEFYAQQTRPGAAQPSLANTPTTAHLPHVKSAVPRRKPATSQRGQDLRTMGEIKDQLVGKIQNRGSRGKLSRKSHLKSLLFGLSAGVITIIILLFSFFNERIIAPLITPSRNVSTTAIITDPGSGAVGPEPIIIIPKINVEVPVVYDEMSTAEADVQKALERGVVHYPTTPYPGQIGNGAIFGHSSNNILNKGQYKFAFVLLGRLEPGDLFILHYNSVRYVYRVYEKKVVPPTDMSVLGPASKPATFTLITCDPPGTSINRLIVVGEQITPDPNANVASTATPAPTQAATLPSDPPSLWHRLTNWLPG